MPQRGEDPIRASPGRNVLLTGFGPFPGVPENASAGLAARLADRACDILAPRTGYTFHAATLPTEWDAAPVRLAQLQEQLAPALLLHFGVSATASGFVIETRGANACRPALDAAGRLPHAPRLTPGGPDAHAVTIPVVALVDRLRRAGFTAQASSDAGAYLCNAVLYRSLAWAAARTPSPTSCSGSAHPRPRVGFIHLPHAPDAAFAPLCPNDGALIILDACLAALDPPPDA